MHNREDKGTKRNDLRLMPQVVAAAVFALLTLALLAVHVLYFAPNRARVERATPFAGDRAPLAEAMDPESVAARFRDIADLGSRAPGQPGLEATAQYIEEDFTKLGFEIHCQDVGIPYPLLREGSGWMSNETFRLVVLPFRPNFVQPVTTGAQGIDGELFLATDEAIRNGIDFTGKIAVIDTGGSIFKDFGLDPVRYAALARKAVFLEEERLLQAKISYERNPSDLASPAFAAYCAARKLHDEVNNLSGLPLTQLLRRNAAASGCNPSTSAFRRMSKSNSVPIPKRANTSPG